MLLSTDSILAGRRGHGFLPKLFPCLLLLWLLCSCSRGWVPFSVNAAVPREISSQHWEHHGDGDSTHVYANLEELNDRVFGAPYTFEVLPSARGDLSVAVPTDEEIAVAVKHARDGGRRAGLSTLDQGAASDKKYSMNAAQADLTTSMCGVDFACPRSSLAWASGSFTSSELLTPYTLSLPVGLTLKLSLCCQYRFDGTLLRDLELFDDFLQELLQASPFQVLSAEEKRDLFPQERALIADTWGRRRVYDVDYTLTDVDVAEHNDGDGDVLVLVTGALTPSTLLKLLDSSPSLSGSGSGRLSNEYTAHPKPTSVKVAAEPRTDTVTVAPEADVLGETDNMVGEGLLGADADIQLRITSRVLKCKCPHIVTVMPILRLQRDVLPPISVVGLGSHCGLPTSSNGFRSTHMRQSVKPPHVRRVRGADGTVDFAVSFDVTPPVAPASLVTWTVRRVVEKGEEGSGPDEREGHVAREGGRRNFSTSPEYWSHILRHSRLLPVQHTSSRIDTDDGGAYAKATSRSTRSSLGSAASPFFIVEPNVRYDISVRISRRPLASALLANEVGAAGGEKGEHLPSQSPSAIEAVSWPTVFAASTERVAHGRFVLRLPINRSWALPPVRPALHFGFRRLMRLTNVTTARDAVMAALDPYYPLHPLLSASLSSEVGKNMSTNDANAGGPGGTGHRLVGGVPSSSTAARHRRPLSYYGYWENTPLHDQPLPQQATRVMANPYMHGVRTNGDVNRTGGDGDVGNVPVTLFLGHNLLAYVVRDVDDVCDPVILEERDLWAVQSHITTTGPTTSCGEQQDVSALVLRELLMRMRVEPKLGVTIPNTTWLADPVRPAEAAREGYYSCERRSSASDTLREESREDSSSPPVCVAVPDVQRDASEVHGSLRLSFRGVYEVAWVARVLVRDEQLIPEENLDPLYTRVVPASSSGESTPSAFFVVEVRSRPLLVVRRLASYPHMMTIQLPMHARRWVVSAPRVLAEPTTPFVASSTSVSAPEQQDPTFHGDVGRRRSSRDVLSGDAPKGYWRWRSPVHVLSVDERMTAELDTDDVPNVQRTLPSGTLEYVVQDPGDLLALSVVIDGEVRVFPYTSQCPETHVEYRIDVVAFPPAPVVPSFAPIYTEESCVLLVPPRAVRKDEVDEWYVPPCASAQHPPYLVERTISVEEQEGMRIITTAEDGGSPLVLEDAAAARRPLTALMACGVEAYHYCDVVWSARNLVSSVQKAYSLRRCQRPPDVVFHEHRHQQGVSYPQAKVFDVPSLTEIAFIRTNASFPGVLNDASTSADAAKTLRRRHRRRRRIIPVAGFATDVGYSFNYTGQQQYFLMELHPLEDAVSHQLWIARHDYKANVGESMVLRRRTRMDLRSRKQEDTLLDSAATYEWGAAPAADSSRFIERKDRSASDNQGGVMSDTPRASLSPAKDAAGASQQSARRGYSDHWDDEQLDTALEMNYTLLHENEARLLRISGVGDASLLLVNYVVRGSPVALRAEVEAKRPEFVRRGMCVERPGYAAFLAISPRGVVRGDDSYSAVPTQPPPAPAAAVLSFCAPQYTFSRYPELFSVYGYEFTWTCPDAAVMTAEKHNQTFSTLYHTPERSGGAAAVPSQNVSETLCQLTIFNHITHTEQRDWFLLRRVYSSTLPATAFVVLSRNAADSLQVIAPSSYDAKARSGSQPEGRSNPVGTRYSSGSGGGTPSSSTKHLSPGNTPSASPTMITMEKLYTAPPHTYPFIKARHIVGKSVVLHVDAPSDPDVGQWAIKSVIPAAPTTVGLQVIIDKVEFRLLPHHPAAVVRRGGGSTVLIEGLETPGLYTIVHTLPDPEHPNVCPQVTLTEVLDVFHAQVITKELFICGDTATLQAVPIPREIAHEFVGQWEVVSLATDTNTVLTAGDNFTGIHFDHGTQAETLVRGLPFGVVTVRWAVYRLLPPSEEAASTQFYSTVSAEGLKGAGVSGGDSPTDSTVTPQDRILVDYDTVEVFVLTENLPSHRLVTLADHATVLTTSSTENWRLELGKEISRVAGTAVSDVDVQVRMRFRSIHNDTHNAAQDFDFSSEDFAGAGSTAHSVFRTYMGLHPRPGSGVLLLERLPVGTVYLYYDIVPSRHVFGRMKGHTCTLKKYYEVERVSAYLTATTSMDHECDGYTGRGRITLCLHTEEARDTESNGPKVKTKRDRMSTPSKRPPSHASREDTQYWQRQVRLIDPAALEDTIKRGAREVERLSGGQCATPWWVSPTTRWSNASYTSAAAPTSFPGRCVSFTVKSGRHLSAYEVSQPLFLAVPRPPSLLSTPTVSATAGLYADRMESSSTESGAGETMGVCPFQGDFISTRVIDGAPGVEAGVTASASGAGQGDGRGSASSAGSRFGVSQRFQIGLPHNLSEAAFSFASAVFGRNGRASGDDTREGGSSSSSGGGGDDYDAWGIRYLSVLHPISLRRANETMRPMVGLRGAPDDVTYEVSISGHTKSLDTLASVPGNKEPEAVVLLRLDLSQPSKLGGFAVSPDAVSETASIGRRGTTTMSSETMRGALPAGMSTARSTGEEAPAFGVERHSLLHKCVEGTLRGADVLQYWTETNRPDGRVDLTAQEWLNYTFAVRDAPVPCDVLFGSLDHLIPQSHADNSPTTSFSFSSTEGGVQRIQGVEAQQRAAFPQEALPSSQQGRRPQAYISLTEMELQVDRIRHQRQWTTDGIEVTGLPADLQSALRHRRVTTSQLHAIEAVRQAQQQADEAALAEQTQRHQQHQDRSASNHLTPTERLTNVLRAYRGLAQGSEVAVLRLRLPFLQSFAVPYDLFLRAVLHKDVLCGTAIDPPPSITDPAVQPTVTNPHSLVSFSRLEVRDVAPVLAAYPPVVTQCEVEGDMPVLTFELTGANFAQTAFSPDAVTLEEVPNPALSGHVASHHPEVGLTACIEEMRRGMNAVVEAGSRKRLYLQLRKCATFKMLSPQEYNEVQESEGLLRRLHLPRYLRVTVRDAIRPDSFLVPSSRVRGGGAPAWRWFPGSELPNNVTATSTDASVVVEVRPTLVRLHLHSSASMEKRETTPTAVAAEVRVDRGRLGQESGGWWGLGGRGINALPRDSAQAAATTPAQPAEPIFLPSPARSLLLCEADLRRYGFQLGIELIGDTWTSQVGEDGDKKGPRLGDTSHGVTAADDGHQTHTSLPRQRSPANMALLNGFSVVEHHTLDSGHHLYLKGGGVYRSHFLNYLFSELLSDPSVLEGHRFVHRYNETFVSITVPPLSVYAPSARRHGYRGGEWVSGRGRHVGVAGAEGASGERTTGGGSDEQRMKAAGSRRGITSTSSGAIPLVRPFSKVEEILFAVPGIATQCRGCLLADRTFFVAGDLTGVWSVSAIPDAGVSAGATSTRSSIPGTSASSKAGGAATVPQSSLNDRGHTRPLIIPWGSATSVPQYWHMDWVCPGAAHRALEHLAAELSGRSDGAGVFVTMDLVLYRLRSVDGKPLPTAQRPMVLLSSFPLEVKDVLQRNRARARRVGAGAGQTILAAPLALSVNKTVAYAAYAQLSEDTSRLRRRSPTTLDYHRDDRNTGGLLALNASVFLKVCTRLGGTVSDGARTCMVVSISDALLTVEEPQVVMSPTSWTWLLLGGKGSVSGAAEASYRTSASPVSLVVLLHHALMTFLVHDLLAFLGVVVVTAPLGTDPARLESLIEDQRRAHVAFTSIAFLIFCLLYAYAPSLTWVGVCLMVWLLSMYHRGGLGLLCLFVASVFYMNYLM